MKRNLKYILLLSPYLYSSMLMASYGSISSFCYNYKQHRSMTKKASNRSGYLRRIAKFRSIKNSSHFSHTSLYHYGCTGTVPWPEEAFSKLCLEDGVEQEMDKKAQRALIASIDIPKYYLSIYDGFGSFNGYHAPEAVNITGEEGNDLFQYSKSETRIYAEVQNWYKNPKHPLYKESKDIDLFYFSGSGLIRSHGLKSSYQCFLNLEKYFVDLSSVYEKLIRPKSIVIGFSNGGSMVLDLQEKLAQKNLPVDLLITIDPITSIHKFPVKDLYDFLTPRHDLTKRHLNFYQTTDTMLPILSFRGAEVISADENYHVSPIKDKAMEDDGTQNHFNVFRAKVVKDTIEYELNKLFK